MNGQLAKLFIRGNLVNVTAKELTLEQQNEVSKLMDIIWNDKSLDITKHKFCNILSYTVGNEYKDKELAMNEIWITIWRTAVDILYHHPKPNIVNDENIRRKYFKNCIYMYMKQILNENKIPTYRHEQTIDGMAHYAMLDIIKLYLDTSTKPIDYVIEEEEDNKIKIAVNVDELPSSIVKKISDLKEEIRDYGVIVMITNCNITIIPNDNVRNFTKKISEKFKVTCHSFSNSKDEDDDNFQQHCEFNDTKKGDDQLDSILTQDIISTLQSRLPDYAQKVCDILIDTPRDFLDTYYPNRKNDVRPKESHIAKYLGMSKNEVSKAIKLIQQQAIALDLD